MHVLNPAIYLGEYQTSDMAKVFLSYAREHQPLVKKLASRILAKDHVVWADWKDIPPSSDWLQQILSAIESVDCFIIVLSPESVHSTICKLELSHAIKYHKKLIGLLNQEVDTEEIPVELNSSQWIDIRTEYHFEQVLDQLLYAIHIDHAWMEKHTRVLINAIEWERRGSDISSLVRGKNLLEAENWLNQPYPDNKVQPTELQIRFIKTSRKFEDLRKADDLIIQANALILQNATQETRDKYEIAKNIYEKYHLNTFPADIGLWNKYKHSPLPLLSLYFDADKDIRGLFWYYNWLITACKDGEICCIDPLTNRILWQISTGKTICAAEISHRSRIIAIGTFDGTVEIWSLNDCRLLATLTGHEDNISTLKYNKDDSLLFSGSWDKSIRIWDCKTYAQIAVLTGHLSPITQIALSPDEKSLVSGSIAMSYNKESRALSVGALDLSLRLWDLVTFKEIHKFSNCGHMIEGLMFLPEYHMLVTACLDPQDAAPAGLITWDPSSGNQIGNYGNKGESYREMVISDDGKYLAVKTYSNVVVFDPSTWQELYSLFPPGGEADTLSFNEQGYLAISGKNGSIHIYQIKTYHGIKEFRISRDMAQFVAISPDGKLIASASNLRLRDLSSSKFMRSFENQETTNYPVSIIDMYTGLELATIDYLDTKGLRVVKFFADGRRILVGNLDGDVRVFDLLTKATITTYTHRAKEAGQKAINPYFDLYGVATESWPQTGTVKSKHSSVYCMDFDLGETQVAVGYADGIVKIWDITVERIRTAFQAHDDGVRGIQFLSTDRLISCGDNCVRIWDLAGNLIREINDDISDYSGLHFHPATGLLVIAGKEYSIRVIDLTNEDDKFLLYGHRSRIEDLTLSGDGHFAASVSQDHFLILWDLDKGREAFRFHTSSQVRSVRFAPGDKRLVMGHEDGCVTVLNFEQSFDLQFYEQTFGEQFISGRLDHQGRLEWLMNRHEWDLAARFCLMMKADDIDMPVNLHLFYSQLMAADYMAAYRMISLLNIGNNDYDTLYYSLLSNFIITALLRDFFHLIQYSQKHEVEDTLNTCPQLINGLADGKTPLVVAISANRTEFVELLLQQGADANLSIDKGFTPLHVAAKMGNLDVARILLNFNAKIEAKTEDGWTPLHEAIASSKEMVEMLIQTGADCNARTGFGYSPLHRACALNKYSIAQMLIQAGADVNSADDNGVTALHFAACKAGTAMILLLIQSGAERLAKDDNGKTPLDFAMEAGNYRTLKALEGTH